jgi:hypothetical protein
LRSKINQNQLMTQKLSMLLGVAYHLSTSRRISLTC